MSTAEVCWCGSSRFAPTNHPDYIACAECGTAKIPAGRAIGQSKVVDEKDHLYGEQYWDVHQAELGLPPLKSRARTDLPERCSYWLEHVLRYVVPPARSLEIGCSHGGFVKLLSVAGFTAIGMEMSPGIIRTAHDWFGVKVVQGPIAEVTEPLGQFDAVLLFDVAEHLADPLGTFTEIAGLLKPGGVLAVQTPWYKPEHAKDWQMFIYPEHTFLFSMKGMRELLTRLGLTHIEEAPPIFTSDLFVFASREPLRHHSPEAIQTALQSTPDGRLALALLDAYRERSELRGRAFYRQFGTKRMFLGFCRSAWEALKRRLRIGA